MFLPISWISPLTVATITVPLGSPFFPLFSSVVLITSNAAFAASALISSCGRNTLFSSNPFPTISSAGISFLSITSIESVPSESSCSVIFPDCSTSPRITACIKGSLSPALSAIPGTALPAPAPPATAAPECSLSHPAIRPVANPMNFSQFVSLPLIARYT